MAQTHQFEDHEGSPLLVTGSQDSLLLPSSVPAHRTRCTWPWKHVVVLCIALAVVSDIGEYLYFAPRLRLSESVICTRYYLRHDPSLVGRDGSVPEQFCKVDSVQNELATFMGWQLFFDSIPAVLLPLPYGYLADKHGRKWILFLALIGYTLSWASTLFFVSHPYHYLLSMKIS